MKALDSFHNSNICYIDLKTNNILLFSDFKIKFGDFGMSTKFKSEGQLKKYKVEPPYSTSQSQINTVNKATKE